MVEEKVNSEIKKILKKVLYYESDYTRDATIPECKELPEVNFTYIPLTTIEAAKATEKVVRGKDLVESIQATMEMVISQVTKWDITKPNGDPVLIIMEELKKVDAFVVQRIATEIKEGAGEILTESEVKN